jgi:hypothetical protein
MSVCTKAIWVFDVFANESFFSYPLDTLFTRYFDNESDVTV